MAARTDMSLGRGRAYTFYSSETGPAASTALACVATLLARWGQRVLLVDWDLDGPGLERFFPSDPAADSEAARRRPGIVQLAEAHRTGTSLDWRECVVEAPVAPDAPAVHLITTGRYDGRPAQWVHRLDWRALFLEADFAGQLERLRTEWLHEHDFVLCHSQPGQTDVAAICAVYLPDVLVALYAAADHHSVEAVAEVARRARTARHELPYDRGHLLVLPVPAWDESWSAYTQSGAGVRVIIEHLGELYRDVLPREVGVEEALEVLRIPGGHDLDLEERVSPEGEGLVDLEEIASSYAVLARMVGSGLRWDAATRPQTAVAAAAETVDFFISYSDADRQWATWIAWVLEHAGYRVLIWAWDFFPSHHPAERMGRGVRAAARTIALLSPAYLASVYGKAEWQAAHAFDPRGLERKLLPVRVAPCRPIVPLASLEIVDLVGIDDETKAARRLLEAASEALGEPADTRSGLSILANMQSPGRPSFPRYLDLSGYETSTTGWPAATGERVGAAERLRAVAGMSAWVAARARGSERQVERLGPLEVAASLTAAALALAALQLVSRDGNEAAPAGVLGRLGVAGADLDRVAVGVAGRVAEARVAPVTREDLRDALTAELMRRFDGRGASGLRRDVATVLRAVGAVETALREAFDSRAAVLQERLALTLLELSFAYDEFARLREDVYLALDALQREMTEDVFSGRSSAELKRQELRQLTLLRQRLLASRTVSEHQGRPIEAIPDPTDTAAAGTCPYRGLSPFQSDDARWFHGRSALTAALVNRLAERLTGPSLVMVLGASGAGKSSLLNAGLLPALGAGMLAVPGSETWPARLMQPGSSPVGTLAGLVADMVDLPTPDMVQMIREDSAAFAASVRQAAGGRGTRRLVLVVDQFEELFTRCSDRVERQDFIRALCAIASPLAQTGTPPAAIVLGLSADRYADCTAHPELMAMLEGGEVVVGPMTADELRHAIEKPAEAAGLTLAPGLVPTILHDLDPRLAAGSYAGYDPSRLPLLSHALLATCQRRRGSVLDLEAYQQAGGIDGAITNTADRLYDGLAPAEQRVVRDLLLHLVSVSENAAGDVRRRVRRAELLHPGPLGTERDRQAVETALSRLVEARLVTASEDHLEITHEALLHAWPRLRSWIDEDRDWLALRRHLSDAAGDWERAWRHPSALYPPIRLAQVHEKMDSSRRAELGALETSFLVASEQSEQRHIRNRRVVAVVVLLALVATIVLAGVAWRQKTVADDQRNVADSRQVAAAADALRPTDPGVAAELSVQAYRIAPTAEALTSLLGTRAPDYSELPTSGRVHGVAFSRDARHLAVAGQDGAVQLWDLIARTSVGLGGGPGASPVYSVAFSADGGTVAGADASGVVTLWDVASHQRTGVLAGHRLGVNSVAFSPDGRLVATGSIDGTARLWDAGSRAPLSTLAGPAGTTAPVDDVAFSTDSRMLASAGADNTVVLWDVGTGAQLAVLEGHTGPVRAVAFSADGGTLASAGDDGTVRLWDVARRALVVTPDRSIGRINTVAFSPDGRTLAVGSDSGAVQLLRVGSGTPFTSLAGSLASVLGLAFGPDGTLAAAEDNSRIGLWGLEGSFLADRPAGAGQSVSPGTVAFGPGPRGLIGASGNDGRIQLWSAPHGIPYWTVPTGGGESGEAGLSRIAFALARTPGGRTLLAAPGDAGAVVLWDTGSRQPIAALSVAGDHQPVSVLAFSPDGRLLASANSGPRVRLWSVESPWMPPREVTDVSGPVNALAFSPDGRVLASASGDGTIGLSDLRSGRSTTLIGHLGAVESVAFSPDGATVGSGGADGSVRLWSAASHLQIGRTLAGHTGAVVSVAFSPDGRTLASAGMDRTVRLWSIPDGARLATLGGRGDVTEVAFSPDGSMLAGAAPSGRVVSWDTDAGRVASRICSGHDRLSMAQWEQYLPSTQAYRSSCP